MASSATKKKADLKVIILGSIAVGKTCFVQRYLTGQFLDSPASTLGAAFAYKQWGDFNIAIWDTAGQERFMALSNFYCRDAGAAIVTFDVTDKDSFLAIRDKFSKMINDAEPDCLCVVVGTKVDLLDTKQRAVTAEDGLILSRELNRDRNNEVPYFETSSINGQNVNRVFEYIFTSTLDGSVKRSNSGVVDLNKTSSIPEGQAKRGCC